jgi:hypothetical protein
MENTICHAEIPVADLNEAKEFYSKVFGWKIEVMPEMGYATFETDSPPGGGFNKVDKVKPGGVLLYIMVEDIEKKLEKIEEAGGRTISGKNEIPNVGWMALFSDVFGNVLGLFEPMQK